MKIPIRKKQGQKFQFVDGLDKNSSVYKKGQNSNVWKDMARIPVFIKKGQNSNVWKGMVRISVFIKIRLEVQCLRG